jgi:Na+/proline symporter
LNLHLSGLDFLVLGLYLCVPVAIGLSFRKKGSKDTSSFFLSGRSLPWWLAGTSMAADTFASDTPLYVAKVIRDHGIAGNWQWWSFAISGMLSVFVLAKLWRRSSVVTDVEFVELRYGGPAAAWLRGLKAFLLAVPFNCILLGGMPVLAMAKVLMVMGGADVGAAESQLVAKGIAISLTLGIVLAYSTVSGLWAIVVNDFVLFWLALAGAVVLAFTVVGEVGGLDAMRTSLTEMDGGAWRTSFLPSERGTGSDAIAAATTALHAFLIFVGIQWWAHRTVDGGGVNIQRMLACKSEGHATAATLWFNLVNYAIRTWPWVLTGLAAVLLYPVLDDPELAYPMAIRDFLPAGLRGFVVASMFAALMTTADTHLNWGASYLVNDIYRRFWKPDRDEAHYMRASRVAILLLAALTALVAFSQDSVGGTFTFLLSFFAGTGTVFLARWLWWRVNAKGELAAILTAPLAATALGLLRADGAPLEALPGFWGVPIVTVFTTLAWVTTTLLTKPVDPDTLVAFYRRTRPPGFWGPVKALVGDEVAAPEPIGQDLVDWLAGLALVLGAMVGVGKALLGTPAEAAVAGAFAAAGAAWLWHRHGSSARGD